MIRKLAAEHGRELQPKLKFLSTTEAYHLPHSTHTLGISLND